MASVFKRGGKLNRRAYWYVSWFDHSGHRRTKCTRTTDKATAERIAAKLESDAALRREGVIDATLDSITTQSRRPIESHLIDYEAKLLAARCTSKHIRHTIDLVRAISNWAAFHAPADISADAVNRYSQELLKSGRSARTVQAHITAVKGFTRWLVENFKLARNPLASIRRPNPKADRRRQRRMLLPDEWSWLIAATSDAPIRWGVAPSERALLYAIAIQTGLRSSELRSLTAGCLFSEADRPFLVCKAGYTKNRKDARQYLTADLATQLADLASTREGSVPLFAMPHETDVAAMLRADLADARLNWLSAASNPEELRLREQSDFLRDLDKDGKRLDFHALRHTCGAWLAQSGSHPKVVQAIMRHSTITLTMDTYGHLFPGQEADAVASMHERMAAGPPKMAGVERAIVTGALEKSAQRLEQQTGRDFERTQTTPCETAPSNNPHSLSQNLIDARNLREAERSDAAECESTPGRNRTCNLRIRSRQNDPQAFCVERPWNTAFLKQMRHSKAMPQRPTFYGVFP